MNIFSWPVREFMDAGLLERGYSCADGMHMLGPTRTLWSDGTVVCNEQMCSRRLQPCLSNICVPCSSSVCSKFAFSRGRKGTPALYIRKVRLMRDALWQEQARLGLSALQFVSDQHSLPWGSLCDHLVAV